MLFFEELKPLRLYSNKKKVFVPINEKDKKHGAAIFLMGTTQEQNEKLMNVPFLYSPSNLFRSYYIDRNVMTYINSDMGKKIEEEEEFDEIQEMALSEGMIHTEKTKFAFKDCSTMDEKILKQYFNKDNLERITGMLRIKESPVDKYTIVCHMSIPHMKNSYPGKTKEIFYSYTNKNEIHLLSNLVYDEKTMDGPYKAYCNHEFIYCILINAYPELNRTICRSIAMALSGQIEWLREEKDKKEFKYLDSGKEDIDNLYLADLIYTAYQNKGSLAIKRIIHGDLGDIRSIAGRRIIDSAKKLYIDYVVREDAMSSEERNSLKDSDFGLPDKRKFPLNDEAHVRAAIKMFGHCDEADKPELAKRIKAKMKVYDISNDTVSEKNTLKKYLTEADIVDIPSTDKEKIEMYENLGYTKVPIRTSKVVRLVKESAFNQETIEHNLNKFKSGENNMLFITGLSGAGKSTLARKYAKDYNAIYISLDHFSKILSCDKDYLKGKKEDWDDYKILKEFFDDHPHYYNSIKSFKDTSQDKVIVYFDYLEKLAKKYKNSRFIIEGIHAYKYIDSEYFKDKSLIILIGGEFTTFYRRMNRDLSDNKHNNSFEKIKFFFELLSSSLDIYKREIPEIRDFAKSFRESTTFEEEIPGLEYADDGYLFCNDVDEDYLAVLQILDTFTKEEFDRVSFYSTYKNNKYIEKRIILRDENCRPMSFMDVYHFPSDPERAQITTGVSKYYRGHHLCGIMAEKLLNSGFAEENGIKKYIWHVHPTNLASEKIAKAAGFELGTEKLDKYGRKTYVYNVEKTVEDAEIVLPSISTESGYSLNESVGFVFNEANSKYDSRLKQYLFKERLKNAREVGTIYDQVKTRNSKIDKTYRGLEFYKNLNLYVDTSYYHGLYLKNASTVGGKRVYDMYFDFLNRLMVSDQYRNYNKITYFFPIQKLRNAETADALLDFKNNLNPLSLIAYYAKREPDMLKRFVGKTIIFIGDNGYFTADFSDFDNTKLMRFKKNITRLLSNENIIDDDIDDIDEDPSGKAAAAQAIDKIETNPALKLNDISAMSSVKISHLSIEDTMPKLIDKDKQTAIFVMGLDSNAVISEINSKNLKSKDIQVYYKPKA